MAADVKDLAGRQKILEGLWLIGIEPSQLQVDPKLGSTEFLRALNANGVHDEFIRRAMAAVDWRSTDHGGADLRTRVENWLQTAGYRPDEIEAFRRTVTAAGRSNDPQFIHQALLQQFNERTAGAVIHKATGGAAVAGSLWNPFRTDDPPKDVRLDYGVAGQIVIPGGGPDLPRPPTPAQQKQQAAAQTAAPPPGDIPGGGTPAGGTGGGGAPGGGATPLTQPVVERLTPEQRRARLEAQYGWAAGLADIPEINAILNRVANGEIDATTADRLFRASDYYRTTTASMREWRIFQKTDPEDAKRRATENFNNIMGLAKEIGIANPDQGRMARLNDLALQFGWSDTEVRRALASEVRYDPNGVHTGTLAKMKNIAREWLVPLSDQAMNAWAQSIVGGTKTLEEFTEYNRAQAKSMFPALGTALDDPNMTTRTYLDPYAQDTANLLGINPEDIDWKDPKWMRAFNTIDPKTNQRTVMSRADWAHTLMNDTQYGFDKTVKGQELRQNLTQSLMESFGFQGF